MLTVVIRVLPALFFLATNLQGGVEHLPLVVPASAENWTTRSRDQQMSSHVVLDAIFENTITRAKIFAVSGEVKDTSDKALRAFAMGVHDSIAQHDVRDAKEGTARIAGYSGLTATFTLRKGDAVNFVSVFSFLSNDEAYAYMWLGPTKPPDSVWDLLTRRN